ncbi:hypothetical protein SDC9_134522 [bioreactor metagenome]|uniref:Uncharacterized protein n=1 Tax=bioreactor metagenome TaxID=1076179 RepID=A0A645DDI2_9ZZZZ
MEHVVIPEMKLAFITSNEHHTYQYDYKRSINLNRYIDKIALTSFRTRLRLNKKLYSKLLDNAIESIKESKDFHDILELIYIKSMDFKKVDKFVEDFYLSIR